MFIKDKPKEQKEKLPKTSNLKKNQNIRGIKIRGIKI